MKQLLQVTGGVITLNVKKLNDYYIMGDVIIVTGSLPSFVIFCHHFGNVLPFTLPATSFLNDPKEEILENEKGCVRYIFARLFLSLSESLCQTRKNVFYFTLKALFILEKIKF